MNRWCSFLTAASLFIHAVLGCCWHHAHHCTGCTLSVSLAAIDSPCLCQHEDDGDDEGDHPCRCPLECGGTCVYVSPERLQVDPPLQCNPLDVVPAIPMQFDANLVATTWRHLNGSPWLRLAVPPHVLDQVLLI